MGRDQTHSGGDITNVTIISRMMLAHGIKVDLEEGTVSTAADAVGQKKKLSFTGTLAGLCVQDLNGRSCILILIPIDSRNKTHPYLGVSCFVFQQWKSFGGSISIPKEGALQMSKIKIALVEGDLLWREALIHDLRAEQDFAVVDTAASKEQGQQLLKRRQFDILLLDLILTPPDYDGLDLAREALEKNSLKIIMLASIDDGEWISSAIQAGVMNVVLKSYFRDLSAIIREAYFDQEFIHTRILQQLRHEISRLKRIEGEWALTRTEREVLQLIGMGHTRKQIMQTLHVSESTVKSHVFHLTKKLNVRSGKEAAVVAKRKGWIL